MNDARRYIVGSDFSIKEIASHLGFSNFSFIIKDKDIEISVLDTIEAAV